LCARRAWPSSSRYNRGPAARQRGRIGNNEQQTMNETEASGGFLQNLGQGIGNFIAGIPGAIGSFFSGLGQGAGIDGALDWIALVISIAMLISVVRGVKRGRIVGPAVSGLIAIALLGWAVS
jgi:hypothetical protein